MSYAQASYILEYLPCGVPPSRGYTELASGSTIGAKRIVPFICAQQHNTFAHHLFKRCCCMQMAPAPVTVPASRIRLRPTLSVAADGMAHIAELSAHSSNWTNSSKAAPPNPYVTCFAYQG